jgi:hypothetical protein
MSVSKKNARKNGWTSLFYTIKIQKNSSEGQQSGLALIAEWV